MSSTVVTNVDPVPDGRVPPVLGTPRGAVSTSAPAAPRADVAQLLLELRAAERGVHGWHADQREEVAEHRGLDARVYGGLGVEGGRHVHLQQPRLQVGVDQDVEAVDLEAVVPVRHEHLAGAVHGELHGHDTLDDDVLK